jgi:hypothetical protein
MAAAQAITNHRNLLKEKGDDPFDNRITMWGFFCSCSILGDRTNSIHKKCPCEDPG